MSKKTILEEHPHITKFAEDLIEKNIEKQKNPILRSLGQTAYTTGRDVLEKGLQQKPLVEDAGDVVRDLALVKNLSMFKEHEEKKEAARKAKAKKRAHARNAGLIALTLAAAHQTMVFLKANTFKKSIDDSSDALDSCVICAREYFVYPNSELKDFKAGCFMGESIIDLNDMDITAKQVDLDIKIIQGIMRLIVPEDWQIHITARKVMGQIENNHAPADEEPTGPILTIYAELTCGKLEIIRDIEEM